MTSTVETTALPFDVANLTLEQLEQLKQAAVAQKKAIREAEKQAKAPTLRSLYRCPGCDCGGITAPADMSLYCDRSGKGQKFSKACEVHKTWAMGQRKPKDPIENDSEPIEGDSEQEQTELAEITA